MGVRRFLSIRSTLRNFQIYYFYEINCFLAPTFENVSFLVEKNCKEEKNGAFPDTDFFRHYKNFFVPQKNIIRKAGFFYIFRINI